MADVYGQQLTSDDSSEYNVLDFTIEQKLKKIRTGVPVKVVAITGGGVGSPPMVDVIPTANLLDGQGNASKHDKIFSIPVARIQGGGNAVIIDPVVGDYGIMVVSDRDISAIKANSGAQSNPGSSRHHSLSDGVYIGGILNKAAPVNYVHVTADGVNLTDKNGNSIVTSSSGIAITSSGNVTINGVIISPTGVLTSPMEITAGFGGGDSVTLQQHTHGGGPIPDPGT